MASDSETIGEQESQSFVPVIEQPLLDAPLPANPLLDISETQSESAWSTDVLTSDTERLTEVDNDDVASTTRSDDASSVARSDDVMRSEAEDNLQPDQNLPNRRLSNPAFNYVNNFDRSYAEYADGGVKNVNVDSNANKMHTSIVFSEFNRGEASREHSLGVSRGVTHRRCSDGIPQETLNNGNVAGEVPIRNIKEHFSALSCWVIY